MGDNEKMIDNLEYAIGDSDIFFIVDDTYEGLLTQEIVDRFINFFTEKNIKYLIYSSNEILRGKEVYFYSFHLAYNVYDNIDVQNTQFAPNLNPRSKIFLSLNRQTRFHRLEIVDHLIKNNLLEHSHVSCSDRDFDDLEFGDTDGEKTEIYKSRHYLDENILYKSLPQDSLQRLKKHLPLELDITDHATPLGSRHLPNPADLYQDSYWSIIGERDFYNDSYKGWTEKVLKSFFFCQPFIVVGLPHTISTLREMGFITFSSVIDESYDKIEDHKKRMSAVKEQIDYLASMNYAEHYNLYLKLLPILNHNRKNYLNLNANYIPSRLVNKAIEWYSQS